MNPAVAAFLTCLLVLCVQGQPVGRLSQCKCSNGYIKLGKIHLQLIKSESIVHQVHQPSIFCPRTEIIITLAANKQKCVDPESPLGQLILKNNKHGKKGAASTTTASSQTTTSSSASLRTTSKL